MKVAVNGIELGFDVLGQQGFPIVLIHGFGLDRSIWSETASKYLLNHRVIMPDVRGHGESDTSKGVYRMSILAEDIIHLLDFLMINKAIVCGHSMGGYIALAIAEKFPERLAGLGLITTHANADSEEKLAGRYALAKEVKNKGSFVLAENLAPRLTHDEEIMKMAFDLLAKTPSEGIISALEGMAARPDRASLLPDIEVPALVVAGADDQIIDLEIAKQMANALQHGRFLPIPGAGHMPMLEKPDALGQGLVSLIHQVKAFSD